MILRRFLHAVFRIFFRLEIEGAEHLEAAGGHIVVVANHVSFLDPALLRAILPHAPVYAIDRLRARQWWVRPFMRFGRTVPIDPLHSLGVRSLIATAKVGHPAIIFPEGRLTATGRVMKLYGGAAFIADRAGVPLLPVFIDGLERSRFSILSKTQVRRRWFPRLKVRILPPVRLDVAPGLSSKARRAALLAATDALMFALPFRAPDPALTVMDAVRRAARRHGRSRVIFKDHDKAMTYRAIIRSSDALGARLAATVPAGAAIGLLLPNALDMIAVALGAMNAGIVPALVDRARSPESVAAWCRAAGIRVVVTSRAVLDDEKSRPLIRALAGVATIALLEDIPQKSVRMAGPAPLSGGTPALILQAREDACRAIVLSHTNLLAGAAQILVHLDLGHADRIFCTLEIHHAAGFMSGVLLPLLSGARSIFYSGPEHPAHLGDTIYNEKTTIVISSLCALRRLAIGAHAYDFRSVRLVFACDSAPDDELQHGFQAKFGLRILPWSSCDVGCGFTPASVPMFYQANVAGRSSAGLDAPDEVTVARGAQAA